MKKHFFRVLALILLVLFPIQNALAEYCTVSGNSSHSSRYLSSFTLTDGTNDAAVSGIQTAPNSALYHDKTSVVLETTIGATLSFKELPWVGEWMHGYVFIDYNNDETFDSETELVSYNYYNDQNSKGEATSNNCGVTKDNMPEWTLPETVTDGTYRMRFKIDWNNIDACGDAAIATNGGVLVDITISVKSPAASRTITVSSSDETAGTVAINGETDTTVTAEGSIVIVATPNSGYKFVNWTVEGEEVSTSATFVDNTDGDKAYIANFAALQVFEVSVSVNDAVMGSADVTAEGQVNEGTEITLTAVANEGYEFVNWTVNGEEVSATATFTTTVNATTEYKANFTVVPTKLTLSDVFATFDTGYYPLTNIIDGDYNTEAYAQVSNGSTVTVELSEQSPVGKIILTFYNYPTYQPAKAKIQVSIDNETYTDVEGCSFVRSDLQSGVITLNAQGLPAKYVRLCFEETEWFDMYEFEVYEAPINVSARTITVSVNDSAMGNAYIGTEGVSSVENQTGIVRITAVANEGYEFVNWSIGEEIVGTSALFLDITEGSKDYVANFVSLETYNVSVSVNDSTMGTAEASQTGEMFKYTEVTFTATANEGYEFVNWTVNGEEVSVYASFTGSIEETAEYVANFRILPIKIVPESVTTDASSDYYSVENMIDGSYTTYYYAQASAGSYVSLNLAEATPLGEIKIYLSSYYYYHPEKGKIQVSNDNEDWTDLAGCDFVYDDITTDPQNGEKYIKLDANGVSAKYVRVVTEEFHYYSTLYYTEIELYELPVNVSPRTISVSVNDDTMGTAYIGSEGTTEVSDQTGAVRITAEPANIGYKFVNWTIEGEEVATTTVFIDRTEGSKSYVANFVVKPQFDVSVASANEAKGTVAATQTGKVYEGEEVTFTATAADGYKFIHWLKDDAVLTGANPYTEAITESITLVGVFERDPELNRSSWTVYDVSSEYAGLDGGQYVTGDKAIDGNTSTYWHTDWDNASNKTMPQWIVFDLGELKSFDSFNYVSRSESQTANGNINEYKIYVSDEAPSKEALTTEMTEVHSGAFTYPAQEHKVTFANGVKGRYVMLYATSSYGEGGANMFANCAEFYLYSNSYTVSVSSSNSEIGTAYIGEEGVTTQSCSVEGTDVVTITAIPAAGYRFVNWTVNGVEVSTDAVYTTEAVTESLDYVANFEFDPVEPRTVKVSSNDNTKGYAVFVSPQPEGTATDVTTGEIVTVEAIAQSSDDFFVNWTIDGVEVGTEPTYEYLGAEAATIQANFISKYVVTIETNEGGTISVKTGETYVASGDRVLEGNYIKMSVTENQRYELKKLFVNGEDVFIQYKYNPDYSVQVNGPITISAEYGEPICYFTYECTGNGWIEAWETDTYDAEADDNGTLELPVLPDGVQYAYGEAIPFDGTAAIFACPADGESLLSLTINGEEIDITEESDIVYYGDYFIDKVESAIHAVAEFTGESTGVERAEVSDSSIYAVAGGVQVALSETTTVEVYTITGTLVSEQLVSDQATIALQNGVYIVKASDKVVKVVVK